MATLVATTITVAALSRPALAEDTSRVAAATVLFDEGVALMEAGRPADACPKLAKSQELAPSGGTLLALADCYEKIGRVASAWVAYREAAGRAAAAGKGDAEAAALERAEALAPRLPRITITAPHPEPGLEIWRDGAPLKSAELALAVPIDPGIHEIRANAPSKRPWAISVTAREGRAVEVSIPALESMSAITPIDEGRSEGGSAQRTLGVVAGGVGIASIAAGTVFGALAIATNDRALEHCPNNPRCDAEGLALTDDAKAQALASTVLFSAGAVALAAGAVLYFTAKKSTLLEAAAQGTTLRW